MTTNYREILRLNSLGLNKTDIANAAQCARNFNTNSVWNLKPIDVSTVRNEVNGLLISGEMICMAFRTVRDQLVFTNKRIIAIDVQGITGKRKSFSSLPYSRIQYFSIQTPGFAEIIPDLYNGKIPGQAAFDAMYSVFYGRTRYTRR